MMSTKLKVLVEIAARQPNVRQVDIATRLRITPQAVSEYVRQLVDEGYAYSEGPSKYRATNEGVELIIKGAQEMGEYSKFILERVVKDVKIFTAIASADLKKDQKVRVGMKDGLLYAGKKSGLRATGVAMADAKKGEDVGVAKLEGIIELEKGTVTICKVPRIERGGSANVNYKVLKKEVKDKKFVYALGVESLIALRKANKKPRIFFGVKEGVVEAAHHGISSVVVCIDDEIPNLLSRLEKEKISYSLIDLKAGIHNKHRT